MIYVKKDDVKKRRVTILSIHNKPLLYKQILKPKDEKLHFI